LPGFAAARAPARTDAAPFASSSAFAFERLHLERLRLERLRDRLSHARLEVLRGSLGGRRRVLRRVVAIFSSSRLLVVTFGDARLERGRGGPTRCATPGARSRNLLGNFQRGFRFGKRGRDGSRGRGGLRSRRPRGVGGVGGGVGVRLGARVAFAARTRARIDELVQRRGRQKTAAPTVSLRLGVDRRRRRVGLR